MSGAQTAWDQAHAARRIREIADKLDSPHADKTYLAKEDTKAELRRDLLAMLPLGYGV
jgi:hypothetical protein